MKRGDIVIASPPDAYGKPRPILVVRDDAFMLSSVTVLPFTSELHDAPLIRPRFDPDAANGLKKVSDPMIDKAVTVPRAMIGQPIGHVGAAGMRTINHALARFLGLLPAG